jgi:hypothetical protein
MMKQPIKVTLTNATLLCERPNAGDGYDADGTPIWMRFAATTPSFDHASAGVVDSEPTDLDRLAASLDYLRLCCCAPGMDKAGERPAGEFGEQQCFGGAAPIVSEKL